MNEAVFLKLRECAGYKGNINKAYKKSNGIMALLLGYFFSFLDFSDFSLSSESLTKFTIGKIIGLIPAFKEMDAICSLIKGKIIYRHLV